jgi:hypothetical protein
MAEFRSWLRELAEPEHLKLKVQEVGPKFVKLTDGQGPILWERTDPFTGKDKECVQGMTPGRILLAYSYELRQGDSVRFLNGDGVVFVAMPPMNVGNVAFCRESAIMPLCHECNLREECRALPLEDYLEREVDNE